MSESQHNEFSPRRRSRAFYVVVIVLPLVVNAIFLASGRFGEYWSDFAQGRFPGRGYWAWTLITVASTLPLFFAAWELGWRHRGARLLGYEAIVGLRDVLLLAVGRELGPQNRLEFPPSPKDRPMLALAMGAVFGVLVPTFFLSAMPELRTTRGVVWLVGAGIAMGAGVYFNRRAIAYLNEEPRYWSLLRQFRLLNPKRYQPAGRIFVRSQIISAVFLAFWWLVVGSAFVLSNP
jgi:hypothetical protein